MSQKPTPTVQPIPAPAKPAKPVERRYNPQIFMQKTREGAREIILTPGAGMTTDERWEKETPWLADRMEVAPSSTILDWGCGIGRIAKELVGKGHRVVGVDISLAMLKQSYEYVDSVGFAAVGPTIFKTVARPESFDAGYSFWVLQHSNDPRTDIDMIHRSLKPGAPFFLLNNRNRCVPFIVDGKRAWIDDKVSIPDLVAEKFEFVREFERPAFIPAIAYFREYRRKP